MNYKIRAVQEFYQGREMWTASHPELLGCHAMGRTCGEATHNLPEVRDAWIRLAKKHGGTVPAGNADLWIDVMFAPLEERA